MKNYLIFRIFSIKILNKFNTVFILQTHHKVNGIKTIITKVIDK